MNTAFKLLLVAMIMCQAFAAFVTRGGARGGSLAAAAAAARSTTTTRLNERINTKIDLDSPKVATMVDLEQAKKGVYCRCWKSEKFPMCDGAHAKHNEATGDNVGPLIVTAKKPE